MRTLLIVACLAVGVAAAQAPPAPEPAFAVTSIKLSSCKVATPMAGQLTARSVFPGIRAGRWQDGCITLSQLVTYAYGLHSYAATVEAGSPQLAHWINTTAFAIVATTTTETVPDEQCRGMLRQMLETRFQLKTHTASKSFLVYALTVASDGPKLRPAGPCDPNADIKDEPGSIPRCGLGGTSTGKPGEHRMAFRSFTMADLAALFESSFPMAYHHPVVDRTNLSGSYDFDALVQYPPALGTLAENHEFLGRWSAALAAQDGLNLDFFHTTKLPIPVRVVDHAVIPSN